MTVLSYPIPAYSNLPIEPQYYQPSRFEISNITLGATTTITTSTDQNYALGQQVRLLIPPNFGCRQLNFHTGFVISIPSSTQVVLDIFSIGYDPFTTSIATTKPQIVAIGDNNSGYISSTGNNVASVLIPGSFINISPL